MMMEESFTMVSSSLSYEMNEMITSMRFSPTPSFVIRESEI